jgi:hypothetical protein
LSRGTVREPRERLAHLASDGAVGVHRGRLARPWGAQTARSDVDATARWVLPHDDQPIVDAVQLIAEKRGVPTWLRWAGLRRSLVTVTNKRWYELSPRTRQLIVVGAVFEGLLKVAALIDLLRRPQAQLRGTKARWAAAIVLINSVGVVPIGYFTFGRRKGS